MTKILEKYGYWEKQHFVEQVFKAPDAMKLVNTKTSFYAKSMSHGLVLLRFRFKGEWLITTRGIIESEYDRVSGIEFSSLSYKKWESSSERSPFIGNIVYPEGYQFTHILGETYFYIKHGLLV